MQGRIKEEQAQPLRFFLNDYDIDKDKLKWFVLNNAFNNNTTLIELQKLLSLILKKRLQCANHIINLFVYAFIYGKDPVLFEKQMKKE